MLLQHSANIDLQDINGVTALMAAAGRGHEVCVKALLRAKANTELLDNDSRTALQRAEIMGHTSTAQLLRQHATPPQPAAAAPAAPPDPVEPEDSAPASLPLDIYESAQLRAAEGGQVGSQGRAGRRVLLYYRHWEKSRARPPPLPCSAT